MKYISLHFQEDISPGIVAQHLKISERTLFGHLNQGYGLSAAKAIELHRLNFVRRLLKTTAKSIAEITSLSGYRAQRTLEAAYHKTFGHSMASLRRG